MKALFLSMILLFTPAVWAQTHGYLGFWYDFRNPQSVPETKTTKENGSLKEAKTEIEAFCQQHDAIFTDGSTGCFGLTLVNQACVAAAWSHKRGLLRPDNVYIAQDVDFKKVAKLAQKKCKQDNGWFARCEVETVYCSDQQFYEMN